MCVNADIYFFASGEWDHMTYEQLAEYAPQLVGIAASGFIVAFILRKIVFRTMKLIDPILLRSRLPIELVVALSIPTLIAFLFDESIFGTVVSFNVGYTLGNSLLEI